MQALCRVSRQDKNSHSTERGWGHAAMDYPSWPEKGIYILFLAQRAIGRLVGNKRARVGAGSE